MKQDVNFQKKMLKLLKLLFLAVLIKVINSNYISIEISVSDNQINTLASYTLTLRRDFDPLASNFVTPSNVPIGSVIQFVFPGDYVNMAQGSTVPCTDAQTGLTLNCQYSGSTNIITVKNYYSASNYTGNYYPSIKIDSILNPPKSGQTANFLYYIKDSSGIIIDQSPSANNGIYSPTLAFTPGTFLSYKISAQGATILTRSRLVVSLTPRNQIGSSNKIVLDFPLTWTNDLQSNRTIITTPTCSAITNTANTITCSYTTMPSPVNRAYITVTGLTSTSLSSAFSFSIQSVLTPPTVDSSDTVVISSQQSDGSKIDTCTTVVSNLSPIQFQIAVFESLTNTTVQSSFNGSFALSIAKPFAYYDTVVFTLPSNFLNAVVSSTSFSSFSQTRDMSSSSITLSNFPSTSSRSTSSQLNFTLQSITNPVSVNPVSVVVSFYRLGSLYQQSTLSYSAVAGTAQSFKIIPSSNFVYAKGPAQMEINSSLMIPSGSRIKVSYPANLIVSDSNSVAMSSAFLNGISVSSSTFRVTSNTIYFENVFQSNFTSGLILIDFSQFSNPLTVQPTTYLVTVETADGHTILTGSLSITATLKTLIINSLSSSSYKVLDTSVLTITVELNYAATAISVILPPEIAIKTGFQTTCLPNTLNSCYLNGYNLTFQGNFQSGVQTLVWGNVQNPNSLQSTQSFSIFTYNRGWGVQKSLGNIYLQMNQTNIFPSVLIVPSSLKNNEMISVKLTISFPSSSPVPSTLTIIFPNDLDISSATCDTTCTKIGNNISFAITNWSSTLITTVSNVINGPSFKPIGDFIIQLTNSNNFVSLYQTKSSWTNNIASSFVTTVSAVDAYRGENALFKFNVASISGKQNYLVLKFTDLFGALTVPPSGASLLTSRSVRYNIQNQASTDFSLTLQAPLVFGDYTFSTQTYLQTNGVSYLIGQSVSNIWRHSCYNTVCRKCDPANNSICIDCYNTTISDYYIYDTALQTCTRDCLSGFFMSGNVCSPCSGSCLECANISTNCTSCNPTQSLFLDTVYMKCVSTCADGYYKNTQIQTCLPCSAPCLYCSESPTKCTYCPLGKFLLNQDCLDSCPTNKQYIENPITRNCDLCNSNCLTCQNTTTTCLTCNVSALLFLQNNKCVSQCVTNSFANLLTGTCVPCQSPCNLCYNDSTVCSTCLSTSSTPIYYKFGCIAASSCPLGNFVNLQNSSCDACPSQCSSCTSFSLCTACNSNFALYQNNCIPTCPNTTYQLQRVCLPCTGCLTCNVSPQQCTSCIPSQFLYNGICSTQCPDGTFKNTTTKTCQPCTSDCPTCRNTTFCLTCVTDLYLYLGKCSASCPVSTFATVSNSVKVCQQCPSQCSQCTSLTQCQKCKPSYNLQNDSSCVLTCSKGIAYNQVCYPCGLNCANCNQTSSQCQLCDNLYVLYEGKCVSRCPSTTLSLNGFSCVPCTVKFGENCTTCSFNSCLSCSDGQLSGGQCIPCPQGKYARSSKCANCPSSCKSCYNETYCISCIDNNYMEQNYCTNICPLNKIPNGTVCTACLDFCAVCNLQNSLCSVCTSGYYLYESRCVNECPSQLVVNLNTTKCVTQEQFYQDYSKQAKIVYFPFSIASGILFMIGIIIKCYSKMTHLVTLACAVISIAQIGGWAAFTYVEFSALINYHFDSQKSFILLIIAIAILIMIGITQTVFYCKYLKADPLFTKWEKNHFCTDKVFLVLSVIFNFKLYRIVHTRMLERDQFSMKLISPNKLLPFSLLSIVSLAICSLPVMIGASLALYFSISRDQQFFAALDCLTITSIMVILTLLDLRHQTTYFIVQVESENLKRQIYEEDSLKFSINGQAGNEMEDKDMSKAQLINQVSAHLGVDSGTKFRGQSDLITTGFNQTGMKSQQKPSIKMSEQTQQVNLHNEDIQFQQIQQQGDQAINNRAKGQKSQQNLLSEQDLQESQEEPKRVAQKWVEKKFDRHGYLLKTNQQGQTQRYDQDGYRVEIDDKGEHKKFDKDGNQVQLFMGTYCVKDQQGFYQKDEKKYDKRGYQVRKNLQGQNQFFNQEEFKVVEDEDGNVKLFDQYGHEIIKDQEGNIHRMNSEGYEAFISQTGEVTYKDKEGNFVRKNENNEYEMYNPQDGFKIVKDQNGNIQKYDNQGYRIEKDKWGNIYRYDNDGYRIVFGPNNKILKYDKDGYEILIGPNGQIKRYDKDGYEVKIDQNGKKKLYDQNGYQVIKDYDGDITLYDSKGYIVVIDPQTGEHKKYTQEGLRVVEQQDGTVKFYDKRGHQVVQLPQGFYQKYDSDGNKIDLDLFGFQVESNEKGQQIRYNKIGEVVNERWFQQKLMEQQKMQEAGLQPINKLKRFKPAAEIDLQGEYSKMVQQQNLYMDEDSLQEEPNLVEFHHPQIYKQHDLDQQFTELKDTQMGRQHFDDKMELDLNLLQQVDHHPQKEMREKITKQIHVKKNGNFLQGDVIDNDHDQDYVQLKSIADASINQRSFENQGVQPIDANNSQYSQLQSLDQLSPNLALNSKKRKRGQRSQMSFIDGQNHDTKTQYNHKTVNVQIKNNNLYDQNQEVQSLNQQNWIQQAQGDGGIFYNFTKDFSNANTNTNMNELIFMDDVQDQNDTLSSFVKENSHLSHRQQRKMGNQRYDFDQNTIQEMENQLFDKQFDQGIRERRQFKLSNGPNPLVQYAKNLQSTKKSLQQRMYLEDVGKKRRRR